MKKGNNILIRAAALALSLLCVLTFSSCFHDNWNIPEREEVDLDLGMLLGGLLGGAGGIGNINLNEILPSGIVLTPSEDGGHYIVADASACTAKRISIPASYRGVPVAEIADSAFAGLETLEEIWLPSSIKKVGAGAFEGCTALAYTEEEGALYLGNDENPHLVFVGAVKSLLPKITINKSTQIIAAEAFFENMIASEITIPDSVVTVGERAFKGCTNVYSVDIGDGVEEICDEAFSGLSLMEKLTFGKSLASIGANAFYGCEELGSLNIPDSVTEIGEYAFYGCSGLESLKLGDGLRVIRSNSFSMCYKLQKIDFGNAVEVIEREAFKSCTALETVDLPSGIELIHKDSFKGCVWLEYNTYAEGKYLGSADNPYAYLMDMVESDPANTDLNIHKDTRRIAATLTESFNGKHRIVLSGEGTCLYVDDNCLIDTEQKKVIAGLMAARIPDDGSVTSIADYAFYGMTDLDLTRIPLSVTEIGDYAFAKCRSISGITIYGARSIGNMAFQNCYGLVRLNLNSDLHSIGEHAFAGCTKLGDVAIPDSVTEIGKYAFAGCISIEYTYVSARIENIPEGLFEGCTSLISANHGAELASIGANAFKNCRKLEVFDFNDGLEYIGESAFARCRILGAIRLPNSVIEIGESAFASCAIVQTVSVGNGIKRIGAHAFDDLGVDYFLYNGNLEDWNKVDFGAQSRVMTVNFTDGTSLVIPAEGGTVRY